APPAHAPAPGAPPAPRPRPAPRIAGRLPPPILAPRAPAAASLRSGHMTEVFDIRCTSPAAPAGSGTFSRALTRGEAPFALVPEETERRCIGRGRDCGRARRRGSRAG